MKKNKVAPYEDTVNTETSEDIQPGVAEQIMPHKKRLNKNIE